MQGVQVWSVVRELRGLPRWINGRESTCQCKRHRRHVFDPWVGKMPWRREWLLTPIFLPGKSHGQRNLVGYGPWGRRESTQLKQLSSSNRSRELRSQWCRQKKKRQLLGLLHAISPEKREISTYDTESFSSSSLCSPFLHGIYMDMKRARSFCASECLFLFFSASLLTPLKHLQAKFPLFKLCWKSELNVIGGYQMLGFGKILRTSGQFVLCWKDI